MTAPRVSVVIPTRNRELLLPNAIRSVLAQTFRGLEVLVVDDASEDGTREVVAGLSDGRVRYLRRESRQGGSAARNAGIRASRGEFVAFLDDDDEWLPDKLELQLALFAADPELGVVYSSYLVVDRESGRVVGRKVAERRGDLSRDLLVRNVIGNTSSVVARRSCFETAGLFDEQLPSFEDYDLWLRLSTRFRFDFVERDLAKYYVHGRKVSTDLGALDCGIDILRRKHGSSREFCRNLARQSLGLGVQYCSRGEGEKGRRALVRSIRLAPFQPRPYLNLALSLLGKQAFQAAHGAKGAIEALNAPSEPLASLGGVAPAAERPVSGRND